MANDRVNHKRAARLMRELSLKADTPQRFVVTRERAATVSAIHAHR